MADVTKLCGFLCSVFLAWTPCIGAAFAVNNRPVIGVLSQETTSDFRSNGDSFILSSYIKYLEAGGARVVPIRIFEPETYYRELFLAINGMLFPGGGADPVTSGYAQAARTLFKMAIEANSAGDYFPVWGTCLGFQQLSVLVAGENLLTDFDAENLNLPLNFTYPGFLQSRLFSQAPAEIIGILKTQNVTANAHHEGISPEVFFQNSKLKSFFRIISTNRGRQGKLFISSYEGFNYPVYGTQFHPEKNTFTWAEKYPWLHSKDAVKVTQYFANFIVNEARRSNHAFLSERLAASAVIENYKPVYLKNSYPFESKYYFNYTKNVFNVV